MNHNPYLLNVNQTNGCRNWQNPLTNVKYDVPENPTELFIKNLPKEMLEIDLLPHFERFGPIYQFRLLIDYDNCNRGFAYLIYFYQKSALQCLDLMGYFMIKQGTMLDVELSQERSHLLALNIPTMLTSEDIESEFTSLYKDLSSVYIRRNLPNFESEDEESPSKPSCSAILAFPNHKAALNAKRWSGVGTLNLWNRSIKILWASVEQVEDLLKPTRDIKHILAHNMPDNLDPEVFGSMICEYICHHEVLSIRPVRSDWLIAFTNAAAAFTIFEQFNNKQMLGRTIFTELVDQQRLKTIDVFADFDFELRCMCIANYWDPPIFIYGRIMPFTKTQVCAVIIKNNRINQFTTFFVEMIYKDLVEMHARICETLVLIFTELKELPKKNIVIKCSSSFAFIVGAINDLKEPVLMSSNFALKEGICLYLGDIYALSKMCYLMISSEQIENIHVEYKVILHQKNIEHQMISGFESEGNILGCIEPRYRHGKPLKFLLDSRHMILAMCDMKTFSNVDYKSSSILQNVKDKNYQKPMRFRIEQFELIPVEKIQRQGVHYTFRPFIEFDKVDTYGPLRTNISNLMQLQLQQHREEAELRNYLEKNSATSSDQDQDGNLFMLNKWIKTLSTQE